MELKEQLITEEKYVFKEREHNLRDPQEIVPEIIKLLNPKSVVDVGCGLGTFLYCFKEKGVNDVLGIDGPWIDRQLLSKYLNESEFLEWDLEKEFNLKKKYDLVICLEMAQMLSAEVADSFVKNLIASGKVILFSSAIPFQSGQNHINEQWLTYWEALFLKHDYVIHDVIRPIFWDDPKMFWWYKQNMVLVTPKDFRFNSNLIYNPLKNVVHYELYTKIAKRGLETEKRRDQLEKRLATITNGELTTASYMKLLIKSIIGNKHWKRLKS